MKKNPCFQCICNSRCRLKKWEICILHCSLLSKNLIIAEAYDSSPLYRGDRYWEIYLGSIKSKKVFDMEKIF